MERFLAPNAIVSRIAHAGILFIVVTFLFLPADAQNRSRKVAGGGRSAAQGVIKKSGKTLLPSRKRQNSDIKGESIVGDYGIQRVNAEVMQSTLFAKSSPRPALIPEREVEVDKRQQNPESPKVSRWPYSRSRREVGQRIAAMQTVNSPQVAGTNFTGPTLTDTGAFPPDTMGAVGPTQFVAFLNGRLRTYNKTTGTADGV